ncbi:MAG: hypothetical protein KGM96_16215 [Acidobacteriota bacterium]|nr:hypothetical protein [Acidobacteriota bacterium]
MLTVPGLRRSDELVLGLLTDENDSTPFPVFLNCFLVKLIGKGHENAIFCRHLAGGGQEFAREARETSTGF